MIAERPIAARLSKREAEVLELVADGLPNKEIAASTALSEYTIQGYLRSICGKLGASCRAHAVAIGFRTGLLA